MERKYREDKKRGTCRVCLKYIAEKLDNEVISVFETYNNKLICDKINNVVHIDVHVGDGLPDKICLSCVQSLETAYEFKQKCKHSDDILRSAIRTGAPSFDTFIEVPVKLEPLNCLYDRKDLPSLQNQNDDVKHEQEDLSDGAQESNDVDLSEQAPSQIKGKDLHLECHDCGQFFRTKFKLRIHWKKEHMPSQLICPNCKRKFKTFKSLNNHIRKQMKHCTFGSQITIIGVGKSRVFQCPVCSFNTTKIKSMSNHWELHSGERSYACELCGKSFAQFSGLFNHQARVHKIRAKEYTCQYCGKHIIGSTKFYVHMKAHNEVPHPCTLCNKVLKTKKILQTHMKRHSSVRSHICDICQKGFCTSSDLINHKEKSHIRSKLYKCDRCQYESRIYNCMSVHKKRHTDTNIACNICGMFFNNEQQLALHILRHNKTIQCMFCPKMFYKKKYLNVHLKKMHSDKVCDNKVVQKVKKE